MTPPFHPVYVRQSRALLIITGCDNRCVHVPIRQTGRLPVCHCGHVTEARRGRVRRGAVLFGGRRAALTGAAPRRGRHCAGRPGPFWPTLAVVRWSVQQAAASELWPHPPTTPPITPALPLCPASTGSPVSRHSAELDQLSGRGEGSEAIITNRSRSATDELLVRYGLMRLHRLQN